MAMTHTIDFSILTSDGKIRNLSGHEKGLQAREHFKLDDIDRLNEAVVVHIPSDVYALSSSFVQGMFVKSLNELGGSVDKFFERYQFDAPSDVIRQVQRGLRSRKMLEGRASAKLSDGQ